MTMFDRSRRAFLAGTLGTAGAVLLPPRRSLHAEERSPGELAISGIAQPELAGLDALMIRFVKEQQVPGAALAVTKDSRLVYARGFGLAMPAMRPTVNVCPTRSTG